MDINLHPAHYLCVLTILWILKDIQATAFCPLLKDRGLPHARMVVNKQKGIIRAQWGLPEKRLLYRFWSLLLVSSKSVLSTSLNFISCKLLLKLSLEFQLFCSIYGEVPLTCTLLVMFSTGEWFNMRDTKDTKSVYAEAINDLTVWGIGELTEDIRQHPVKLFYLLWEK